MPVAVLSPRRGYLKLIKEVTRGTPLATTISMPVNTRTLQGKWTRIKADYMAGSIQVQRDVAAGRRQSEGDIAGPILSDSFGHILMAIMGQDTITGAGPYTHTFIPNTTTPSYTIEKNTGGIAGASASEQFSNTVCKHVSIMGRIDSDADLLQYASSWIGKAPTLITATAYTQPTTKTIPAALAQWSYPTGTPVPDLVSEFQVNFDREADYVKGANNTLDISDAVAVAFRVSGFVDMYFLDYTYYNDFVANTQRSFDILWTLNANEKIQIKMTQLFWDDEALEEGSTFIKRRFPFTGTIDTGLGAVVQAILTNNQSVAY
jgi:hypothetical protein